MPGHSFRTQDRFSEDSLPYPEAPSEKVPIQTRTSSLHYEIVDSETLSASGKQVTYSPSANRFSELSQRALDLLDGPYGQRARRRARPKEPGIATNEEVRSFLREGGAQPFVREVADRVKQAHQKLGLWQELPPHEAYRRTLFPAALFLLDERDQSLLKNGMGNFAATSLDLESNVETNLFFAVREATGDNGEVQRHKLEALLGAAGARLLDQVNEQRASASDGARHLAQGEISPFEPDDRPLTSADVISLEVKDRKLLQEIMEAAPIPLSLPVLDVSKAANHTRLDDFQVLMVQHALGSIVPFVDALTEKGVAPQDMDFVTVPYSTNALVAKRLRERGLRLHDSTPLHTLAPRDIDAIMERDVFAALKSTVARAKVSGKKLLIIDDGGIVVRLLSGRAKTLKGNWADGHPYRDWLLENPGLELRIVEQTTRGITEALNVPLPAGVTLVDMARSRAKAYEGPMVGKNAHVVLEQALMDLGKGGPQGKHIAVIGYGVIGSAVAQALRRAGAHVTVADLNEESRARAVADGFQVVASAKEAISGKDMIVGCSGHRSVNREDFFDMKPGCVLASLSSKSLELFCDHLEGSMRITNGEPGVVYEAASASYGRAFKHHHIVEHGGNGLATRFSKASYYLVNNGCPATFTGDVNCVPPEEIQLTEAIKLEAVFQAARSPLGLGIVPLEEERQDRTLRSMDEYAPGWREP